MDEDGKNTYHKFDSMEFQIYTTDYQTWSFPIFVLEAPLKGGPAGIPKWDLRARIIVYLGNYPLHAESVALLLNTITGNPPPPILCGL